MAQTHSKLPQDHDKGLHVPKRWKHGDAYTKGFPIMGSQRQHPPRLTHIPSEELMSSVATIIVRHVHVSAPSSLPHRS